MKMLTRRSLFKTVAALIAAASFTKVKAEPKPCPFAQWLRFNYAGREDVSILIYGPPKSGKSTLAHRIKEAGGIRRLITTETDSIRIDEVHRHDIVLFTRRVITPEFNNEFRVLVRTNRFAPTCHIEFLV